MRRIDYKTLTAKLNFHENCRCPACRYNDEILLYVDDAMAYETRMAMNMSGHCIGNFIHDVFIFYEERW